MNFIKLLCVIGIFLLLPKWVVADDATSLVEPSGISPRIIGGTSVLTPYPWMVSIQGNSNYGWYHFCGGALIAQDWVLTAAHCLDNVDITNMRLLIGAINNSNISSAEVREADWVSLHHSYDDAVFYGDIAIIKLKTPSSNTPLEVITTTEMNSIEQGQQLRVMGWGLTTEGDDTSGASILQEVDLTFREDGVCTALYGEVVEGYWTKFICAGEDVNGKDACQGDSGGPLLWDDNGIYKLAGVVSWGQGCGQAGAYGGFTEVAEYLNWISDRINNITITGPNKIGFLGYGRKKGENYRLINSGNMEQTIISSNFYPDNQYFESANNLSGLTVAANSEVEVNINAVGSYLGEHNGQLILNTGGDDFGINLNSKVLYDLNTDALGVAWEFYSGTNEETEHAEPWFEVNDLEKGPVLRSGVINHEERSILLTYVTGATNGELFLRFDTKVDAEYSFNAITGQEKGDLLLITVNEIDSYFITQQDWESEQISLPFDINRVQFIYLKNDTINTGEDAAYLSNLRVCTLEETEDIEGNSCSQLPDFNVSDTSAEKLEVSIGKIGKGGNETYIDPNATAITQRKGSGSSLGFHWIVLFSLIFVVRLRGKRV